MVLHRQVRRLLTAKLSNEWTCVLNQQTCVLNKWTCVLNQNYQAMVGETVTIAIALFEPPTPS
ncbi:MAG: hypothetical protein RM022_026290 [Nostoc sp. EfeVER01]|uniref:hypothetical protein n=1 Tax=unclassified Nostoc TaxID=2593658 RepID=UPI002AD3485B|nr:MULTISPECIES: hypothetical protein [unclassified Nostoc]MDZ7947995.1 hypothetical protein [Nostoc sp. EfeVER01]MDZ7991386.1 hypothetical protein [Nostoc sp. EspVER01]